MINITQSEIPKSCNEADSTSLTNNTIELNSVKTENRQLYLKKKIKRMKTKVDKLHNTSDFKNNCKTGHLVVKTTVLELVLNNLLNTVNRKELLGNFNVAKSIDEVKKFHNDMIISTGIEFGTKKYKATQQYCIQLLEGSKKIEPVDRLSTGKKDLWPNALGSLRPLWHQVRDKGPYRFVGDQVIRTLFSMQRTVEDYSEIDLSKIDYKANVDEAILKDFKAYALRKIEEFGFNHIEEGGITDYSITPPLSVTASGPNKVPKTDSAAYEASLLLSDKELSLPFKKLCQITKNEEFLEFVNHMSVKYQEINKRRLSSPKNENVLNDKESVYTSDKVDVSSTQCLRKITAVPDSGNKSRTVAIPDYFTQCLLTPFEAKIIRVIKALYPESSNIFDHSEGFNKLKKSIKPGTSCLDAISWTDTFSVKFQKILVTALFGREYSDNWSRLVVKCKWSVKGTNQYVSYRSGQGMGTKGSFAIASLAYLMLMEFLTQKHYPELVENKSKDKRFEGIFNQIGDDSWNQDPKGLILKELTEKCGIPINLSKSKIATDENLVGEFVSRNLNYGNDVSRISASLCRNVGENIFYLSNLYIHLDERTQGFPWKDFIKDLTLLKNSKGKFLYPEHIWSGYYKSLIVDRIIRNDNLFSPLLIALEANLESRDDYQSLFSLRERLKNPRKDVVFRLILILLECEYLYSRITEITKDGKDFLRVFPFGTYTKVYNGSYFKIDYLKNMSDLKQLTLLCIHCKIKSVVEPKMFKISLDAQMPQTNLNDVLEVAKYLQSELILIYESCFYNKADRKVDFGIKARIDRSYKIQKSLTSETLIAGKEIELLINCLPNLGLLFEMEDGDFSSAIAQMDNMNFSDEERTSMVLPVEDSQQNAERTERD